MRHGEYEDLMLLDHVQQSVREPTKALAADYPRHDPRRLGECLEELDRRSNLDDEAVAKPEGRAIVVIDVLREVSLGTLVKPRVHF